MLMEDLRQLLQVPSHHRVVVLAAPCIASNASRPWNWRLIVIVHRHHDDAATVRQHAVRVLVRGFPARNPVHVGVSGIAIGFVGAQGKADTQVIVLAIDAENIRERERS